MAIAWKRWNQSNAPMRKLLTLAGMAFMALATPAFAADDDAILYEVKRGDTLFTLGNAYFLNAADHVAVQKANKIADPTAIPVGKKIRIARRFLKYRSSVARIISVRGNVSHSIGGGTAATTTGMSLGEGALLRTAGSSFATLSLENGSRVSLPSNSDLRIVRLRRYVIDSSLDYDFEVGRGAARSKVTPMTNKNDRYSVKTPKAVSAVRGTEFQSRFDEATGADFSEVTEGAVSVALGDSGVTMLPAGDGLAVTADGAVIRESLIVTNDIPAAGAMQKEKDVRFAVPDGAPGTGMRVSLAADAGFVDEIAEASAANGAAIFSNIDDGNYFVRFRAVSASGIEGMPLTYAFKRRLNTISASGGKDDLGFAFKWAGEGRGTLRYHFQLFRSNTTGPAMVDEAGLDANVIRLSDLPAGDYYWRVASVQYVDGEVSTSWTPFEKLTVSAP
jgi:hypothetical protein